MAIIGAIDDWSDLQFDILIRSQVKFWKIVYLKPEIEFLGIFQG